MRALKIAGLIKQVPLAETLLMGTDGRLVREGLLLEMNPYCRRVVAKGVELARESSGNFTLFTMGPPSAEEVLREGIAFGADEGILLCDEKFSGSDTYATARLLASQIAQFGPYDLILVGKNSVDGETGHIGPQIAAMLTLPFAFAVREIQREGEVLKVQLERDDGGEIARIQMPAVLSVAERLCDPCKVGIEERKLVADTRITLITANSLGFDKSGGNSSLTKVGSVRLEVHERAGFLFRNFDDESASTVADLLIERGIFREPTSEINNLTVHRRKSDKEYNSSSIVVVCDETTISTSEALLGIAHDLALQRNCDVVAFGYEGIEDTGADFIFRVKCNKSAIALTDSLAEWAKGSQPWAILSQSSSHGREIAARVAAILPAGLIGDAIGLRIEKDKLVGLKPAFSGALVADITCTSPVQMVTLRPGSLITHPSPRVPKMVTDIEVPKDDLFSSIEVWKDDEIEKLVSATRLIAVGSAISPDDYPMVDKIAASLGAELCATRKVTDKGWMPRARQVGITGHHLSPELYIGIGLSGKFNHIVGVRGADTILGINIDEGAPLFNYTDIGIVGDWKRVLPMLVNFLPVNP